MRDLYVVTHPEATHHVDRLVGGWYDAALTPRGEQHAERLADALADLVEPERVSLFSSDLKRTRRAAALIAERLGLDVVVDRDLREQSYGVAEGRPAGSTPYRPPPAHGDRLHHHDGVAGSETRYQWATRAYAALNRVLAESSDQAIVVTHGGTATYIISAWIGLPIEAAGYVKFAASPGSIAHLRQDDFFHDRQVLTLDDVRHLS